MHLHSPIEERDPRVAFFDHHAAHWDDDATNRERTIARLAGLRERFGIQPGMDLLEVGCGTGQITGLLADWVRPGRVTAMDFSAVMLSKARAKGANADFRQGDICAAPPGDAMFDAALCFHSFPHFRDRAVALRHLAASLKPGGRLLIVHLAGSEQINAFHRQAGGEVAGDLLPAANQWRELLGAASLGMTSCEDSADLLWVEAERVD